MIFNKLFIVIRMFTKKIILILTFCVIRLVTYGQLLDMKFSDPLQGKALTYDFATCIVQDSSGFIWIGTKNGLNCYDGYQVKKYLYEVADSTSLVNNTIKRLFVDSSGRIWIATMYGVCIYNKYPCCFTEGLQRAEKPSGIFNRTG